MRLLNTLFGHYWITVLIPHLKPENIGLNAAFNIEILIKLIKTHFFVFILKILTRFLLNLLKSQYEMPHLNQGFGFRCGIKTAIQKWPKSVINSASISKYLSF